VLAVHCTHTSCVHCRCCLTTPRRPKHCAVVTTRRFIADAVSHEVGHTLGLSHDGGPTSNYYSGQGDWGE
jgi:hypothetical protein